MIAARIVPAIAWEGRYGIVVGSVECDDLSDCPYWARFNSIIGHDPEATCAYGCRDEPSCITNEPTGGWPCGTVRAWVMAGKP